MYKRSYMSITIDQPSLNSKLSEAKEKFQSTAPAETVQHFTAFIDDLKSSNIPGKALAVSRKAPDFSLPNALGVNVRLSQLLEHGPVILTWYRGVPQ